MLIMQIKIPDYEEMMAVTNKISSLLSERDNLKNLIEMNEGIILRTLTTEERFFINGKPPATNFVEKAYFNSVFEGIDMPALRKQLTNVTAELEKFRMIFDVMKQQITLFQIESANRRNASL